MDGKPIRSTGNSSSGAALRLRPGAAARASSKRTQKSRRRAAITIAYNARAVSLIADDDGVHGVRVKHEGRTVDVKAKCVVLAAGGFQANTEMRTRYLGPDMGARQDPRHTVQYR